MHSTKKALISFSIAASFFLAAVPSFANASTLSQTQIQAVISLLQAFGTDSATIANVQQSLGGAQVSTTPVSLASTTALTASVLESLQLGDKGDRVKLLQTLLAADPSVYPQGVVSGVFGPLTQQALKKYQDKHGLDRSGKVGSTTLQKFDEDLRNNPLSSDDDASSTVSIGGKHICVTVPPGHTVAPGWLRHTDGKQQIVSSCRLPLPFKEDGHDRATTTPWKADTTAPVISNVSVGSIASTSAVISWTTNELATSKVYVGTSSPLALSTAKSFTVLEAATSHLAHLSPLATSTTYYYVVESRDGSGNTATTSQASFVTLAQ